jgi:ribosomal protein L33
LCAEIKGTFSSTVYRERYRNYRERIEARVKAKKLNLKKFCEIVKSEVKTKDIGEIIRGAKAVLDDDENPDWALPDSN